MLKYLAIFVIAFPVLLAATAALADDGVVGTVLEVEGSGSITPAAGAPVPVTTDMPVHLNDTIQTAAASRIFILFIDDTKLTLSENTKFKIDNYVFDPDDNSGNKASYSVLAGAFQYVSGLIGKKENPDVHIDTPVGAIGIRGTDFWAGNLDDQYGVAVNEGRVALKTDAGEEVVNKGQGTSVHDRHLMPAHAQTWSAERFQRIFSTVHLRRHDLVLRRITAMRTRQRLLRWRYKGYMARHKAFSREHANNQKDNQERLPPQREKWREKQRARQQDKPHNNQRRRHWKDRREQRGQQQ